MKMKLSFLVSKIPPALASISLLCLTGCLNQITYDTGNGGVITQHFTQRDYGQILKMANEYCLDHRLGTPTINQIHTGCLSIETCGTENDQYEFKCGDK
jgi:hypothetical protein